MLGSIRSSTKSSGRLSSWGRKPGQSGLAWTTLSMTVNNLLSPQRQRLPAGKHSLLSERLGTQPRVSHRQLIRRQEPHPAPSHKPRNAWSHTENMGVVTRRDLYLTDYS